MKKIFISITIAFGLLLGFASPAIAVTVPYVPHYGNGHVTIPNLPEGSHIVDQAKILSSQEEQDLEAKLTALENDKGIEAAVLTVMSTNNEDIIDFSKRTGSTWQLGNQVSGRGVVIVVAMESRRVRIAVGNGLQDSITEKKVQSILSKDMSPLLSSNNFALALTKGVDKIEVLASPFDSVANTKVTEEAQSAAEAAKVQAVADKKETSANIGSMATFGIVAVILIVAVICSVIAFFIFIGKRKLAQAKNIYSKNKEEIEKEAKNFYNTLSFSDKDKILQASSYEEKREIVAKMIRTLKSRKYSSTDSVLFLESVLKVPSSSKGKIDILNSGKDKIDTAIEAKEQLLKKKEELLGSKETKGFKGFESDSFKSGGFDVDESLSKFSSFKDPNFNNGKSTSGF